MPLVTENVITAGQYVSSGESAQTRVTGNGVRVRMMGWMDAKVGGIQSLLSRNRPPVLVFAILIVLGTHAVSLDYNGITQSSGGHAE